MTYFERPAPIVLIFGSFFAVFLPLCLLELIPNFVDSLPYFALAQAVLLGTTHFFITLAVYVSSDNLRYFASSTRNRLLYFAAPLAILVFFAWSAASGFRRTQPVLAAYLFAGLRFFDFFHVGRQSVGMLQIWKRPVSASLPRWSRRAENAFFVGMAVMQWQTFRLGGRFDAGALSAGIPALALSALFCVIALSYVRCVERLGADAGRSPWIALTYFAMQALCAALAVYDTRLYLAALTLHYVEYHVIMAPRCFVAVPGRGQNDRPAAWLRAHPLLFYAALIVLVIAFEMRNHIDAQLTPSTAFFVHVFDGIFFVHYLIEAFLWRFGDPYYRQALGPLYFAPIPQPVKAPAARPRGLRRKGALSLLGAAVAVLGLTHASSLLSPLRSGLEQRVILPMRAENHLRWGARLLERGDAAAARAHLLRAVHDNPKGQAARELLQVAERALAASSRGP